MYSSTIKSISSFDISNSYYRLPQRTSKINSDDHNINPIQLRKPEIITQSKFSQTKQSTKITQSNRNNFAFTATRSQLPTTLSSQTQHAKFKPRAHPYLKQCKCSSWPNIKKKKVMELKLEYAGMPFQSETITNAKNYYYEIHLKNVLKRHKTMKLPSLITRIKRKGGHFQSWSEECVDNSIDMFQRNRMYMNYKSSGDVINTWNKHNGTYNTNRDFKNNINLTKCTREGNTNEKNKNIKTFKSSLNRLISYYNIKNEFLWDKEVVLLLPKEMQQTMWKTKLRGKNFWTDMSPSSRANYSKMFLNSNDKWSRREKLLNIDKDNNYKLNAKYNVNEDLPDDFNVYQRNSRNNKKVIRLKYSVKDHELRVKSTKSTWITLNKPSDLLNRTCFHFRVKSSLEEVNTIKRKLSLNVSKGSLRKKKRNVTVKFNNNNNSRVNTTCKQCEIKDNVIRKERRANTKSFGYEKKTTTSQIGNLMNVLYSYNNFEEQSKKMLSKMNSVGNQQSNKLKLNLCYDDVHEVNGELNAKMVKNKNKKNENHGKSNHWINNKKGNDITSNGWNVLYRSKNDIEIQTEGNPDKPHPKQIKKNVLKLSHNSPKYIELKKNLNLIKNKNKNKKAITNKLSWKVNDQPKKQNIKENNKQVDIDVLQKETTQKKENKSNSKETECDDTIKKEEKSRHSSHKKSKRKKKWNWKAHKIKSKEEVSEHNNNNIISENESINSLIEYQNIAKAQEKDDSVSNINIIADSDKDTLNKGLNKLSYNEVNNGVTPSYMYLDSRSNSEGSNSSCESGMDNKTTNIKHQKILKTKHNCNSINNNNDKTKEETINQTPMNSPTKNNDHKGRHRLSMVNLNPQAHLNYKAKIKRNNSIFIFHEAIKSSHHSQNYQEEDDDDNEINRNGNDPKLYGWIDKVGHLFNKKHFYHRRQNYLENEHFSPDYDKEAKTKKKWLFIPNEEEIIRIKNKMKSMKLFPSLDEEDFEDVDRYKLNNVQKELMLLDINRQVNSFLKKEDINEKDKNLFTEFQEKMAQLFKKLKIDSKNPQSFADTEYFWQEYAQLQEELETVKKKRQQEKRMNAFLSEWNSDRQNAFTQCNGFIKVVDFKPVVINSNIWG